MAIPKIPVNPEHVSNAFLNILDVLNALKNHPWVLTAPLSRESEADTEEPIDDEQYSIGDCLEDVKNFLEELANEAHTNWEVSN